MPGLPFNVRFREAAKFFAKKVPVTREVFDQLSAEAKLGAFTVATVTKAKVLQDLMTATQRAIDDGLTLGDFKSLVDDVFATRGWTGLTPWHTETVFRTNIQSAYGAGRLQQQRDQADDFPYLQYHATHDDRVRPEHLALDGEVRAITDPFWERYYPPWEYSCRCDAESLTAAEAGDFGIDDGGFDEPSGDFTSPGRGGYDPDLSGLDSELAADVSADISSFNADDVRD